MDRITRVRIRNVRAIASVDLEVSRPLTVLIGENGSGKSTIVECLELLRKAAEPNFFQLLYTIHRGMPGLLRKGASALELGVVVEDDTGGQPRIDYAFTLAPQGAGAVVQAELLARAGYDAWNWEDQGLLRAAHFLYNLDREFGSWWAEGDDEWQPWLINHAYGTDFPAPTPARSGKNMGYTDWTHAQ